MNGATLKAALLLGVAFLLTAAKGKKWLSPLTGKISSKYGNRISPITNKKARHNGIDLAVPEGTPIKAPADGTIALRYYTKEGGRQMVVKHKGGYLTGYAHLRTRRFKEGTKVKQGQIIAWSGNTGISTGAHLHFTIRKNGKFLNPQRIFRF